MMKAFHWLTAMAILAAILIQPVSAETPAAQPIDTGRIVRQAAANAATGDFEQAWQAYTLAIDKRASEPGLLVERALVRLELGDASGAALDCIVQLDADPHNPRAMGVLGLARFLQGRDEIAHQDLKACDDANGNAGHEMVGRATIMGARIEHLHKLGRSKPTLVADELVNVWKGQTKLADGTQVEHEFRFDSRGLYQHLIFHRNEGKIQTQNGTINFVSNSGNKSQWKYEILEDGSMRVGGRDGVRWTHVVSDESKGMVDPKLQGIWRTSIAGAVTGFRTFAVQLNGEYILQNNGTNAGVLKAANGKWSIAPDQAKLKDASEHPYTLSAGGAKLEGMVPGISLSVTIPAAEAGYQLTDAERKRLQEGAKLLFASAVESGDLLLDQGKLPEAIAQFNAAIKANANDGAAYRERGRAMAMSKKFKEANDDITMAIKCDPKDGMALVYRAFCRIDLEDFAGVIADADAAIKLLKANDPILWLAYHSRGSVHQLRGKVARNADELVAALDDFSAALRLNSKDADTYVRRGLANLELGKDSASQADFDAAIQLNSSLREKLPPIIAREKSERDAAPNNIPAPR